MSCRMVLNTIVTPAKAGVQTDSERIPTSVWMPASAGMTKGGEWANA